MDAPESRISKIPLLNAITSNKLTYFAQRLVFHPIRTIFRNQIVNPAHAHAPDTG
ncbi:hypothetical protein BIFBIF_00218 [Bifidobacterium bifidum ATCC 29521 = JCM 1255 = DSM 20456]|nr:hypothetical protein BIFBIF_00218 [Bifidobacterium bifidum ATCC 29521 = JCM 1255 = DSM 20456]